MLCWQTRFWLKRGESKRVIIYIINHVNINIEIFVWKIPSHAALVQHFMDHYVLQIFYKHKLFTAFDTKYYFTLKWHLSGEGGEVYRRNMRFFFGGVVMLNAPCVIRWYNESPQIFDVHANQKHAREILYSGSDVVNMGINAPNLGNRVSITFTNYHTKPRSLNVFEKFGSFKIEDEIYILISYSPYVDALITLFGNVWAHRVWFHVSSICAWALPSWTAEIPRQRSL